MTIHLLKPALQVNDLYEFATRQKSRWMEHEGQIVYPVWTSRKPVREDALLDGGSVFWIIKKQIQCRQQVISIVPYEAAADEKPSYLILCSPELMRVEPVRKKPFQGWRYLEPDNAPLDRSLLMVMDEPPPPKMERDLREAGLL